MIPLFPHWLHILAIASLLIGGACALAIVIDEIRHPQPMMVMNLVWPLTALFGGLAWLWLYWIGGREKALAARPDSGRSAKRTPRREMALAVAKGASHCGAGCTLGDIIAEWLVFAIPGIAVAFGWHSIFAEKIFATWILDYIVAFLLGIAFQYHTIKPMRGLSVRQGLKEAVKADFLSITAWQIGMYGLMAIAQFAILKPLFARTAPVNSPEFWFIMQLAMLAGFATGFPVNWWLIKRGIKEKM